MKIYPNDCARSKANFNKIIGNKITANIPIFAVRILKLQIIIYKGKYFYELIIEFKKMSLISD